MDTLSVRYGCPFFILDDVIRLGQLHEFITEIMKTINEERTEKTTWEFFLHKVFDKTYDEFIRSMNVSNNETKQISEDQIKNIVSDSRNILDGFTMK